MILKLRTVDEGWVYYNVTRKVKIRTVTKEQYEDGVMDNIPDRIEVDDKNLKGQSYSVYDGDLKIINFSDVSNRQDAEFVVYTNRTVYLLNDEGKTVEKLN